MKANRVSDDFRTQTPRSIRSRLDSEECRYTIHNLSGQRSIQDLHGCVQSSARWGPEEA